jgi:hypothetical protein
MISKKKKSNAGSMGKDIRIRVKVSPRLQWVIPHLKKAKARMPTLMLPTQIRSFKPTRKKTMRVLGNVYFETRIIVLATHTQQSEKGRHKSYRVKKIVRLPHHEILDTLAHELAHLRYPEHEYEHAEYTRTIFKAFGIVQRCPYCRGLGKVPMESKP